MREKKGWWEVRDKQGRNTWPEERYTREQVLTATMTVVLRIMCSRCLNSRRGMIRLSHNNILQQVSGRTSRQFGDFKLYCPAEPEDYLDRTYGPSWPHTGMDEAYTIGCGISGV